MRKLTSLLILLKKMMLVKNLKDKVKSETIISASFCHRKALTRKLTADLLLGQLFKQRSVLKTQLSAS